MSCFKLLLGLCLLSHKNHNHPKRISFVLSNILWQIFALLTKSLWLIASIHRSCPTQIPFNLIRTTFSVRLRDVIHKQKTQHFWPQNKLPKMNAPTSLTYLPPTHPGWRPKCNLFYTPSMPKHILVPEPCALSINRSVWRRRARGFGVSAIGEERTRIKAAAEPTQKCIPSSIWRRENRVRASAPGVVFTLLDLFYDS